MLWKRKQVAVIFCKELLFGRWQYVTFTFLFEKVWIFSTVCFQMCVPLPFCTNSLSCRWLHTFLWLFYKYVGGGQHAINYSRHWVSPGSEADFIEQAWVLSQQMLQRTILFIILPLEVSTMTVNGKIIVFQSLWIRLNFHFWVWKMSVRVLRLRYALSYYRGLIVGWLRGQPEPGKVSLN